MGSQRAVQPVASPELKISEAVCELLCCPACHGSMTREAGSFRCTAPACGRSYPVIDGVPALINEADSLFAIPAAGTEPPARGGSRLRSRVRNLLPEISKNLKGPRNCRRLAELLAARAGPSRVLVVGGPLLGDGMEVLLECGGTVELLQTDVVMGPGAQLLCDAHDLPFRDGSFDCVIAKAVLEHVLDPHRCVQEIHRVLKGDGLVYAETPFMQQVHLGRYDFTRFTHLGHRRLFRNFEEIEAGPTCGPGMALAWAYKYFLLSFTRSRWARAVLMAFAHLTSFPLKYFDYLLIDRPGSFDAAAAYYFLGRKSAVPVADKRLIQSYRGMSQ